MGVPRGFWGFQGFCWWSRGFLGSDRFQVASGDHGDFMESQGLFRVLQVVVHNYFQRHSWGFQEYSRGIPRIRRGSISVPCRLKWFHRLLEAFQWCSKRFKEVLEVFLAVLGISEGFRGVLEDIKGSSVVFKKRSRKSQGVFHVLSSGFRGIPVVF